MSVLVKVQKVGEKMEVKPGLYKQDATIADKTVYICLTLWQQDVDKLGQGKSYCLHNLVVKSFNATKYLTTPKASLHSIPENDQDDVVCEPDTCSLMDEILNAEVVGVTDVSNHRMRIKCNSTVEEIDALVGICSKCTLMQCLDRCPVELSVKLVVSDAEKLAIYTFTASQNTIQKISIY